jgi:hypothetical protein
MYTSSYITYSNNPGVWPPTSEMMPPVIALGSMMRRQCLLMPTETRFTSDGWGVPRSGVACPRHRRLRSPLTVNRCDKWWPIHSARCHARCPAGRPGEAATSRPLPLGHSVQPRDGRFRLWCSVSEGNLPVLVSKSQNHGLLKLFFRPVRHNLPSHQQLPSIGQLPDEFATTMAVDSSFARD